MIGATSRALATVGEGRQAWLAFLGVYLAAVAAGFNQFKVPPVLPVLIDAFGFDYTTGGLLMGVFTFSGILLSLPIGLLLQRYALRSGMIVATASLLAGCIAGALAETGVLLLAGRVLEGVGLCVGMIAGQAVIAAWFPDRSRGFPTGLFTSWLSVSALFAYVIAPGLTLQFGWQGVWWVGVALAVIGLAAVIALVHSPSSDKNQIGVMPARWNLGTVDSWLLGIFYGCHQGGAVGFRTWFPTYLVGASLASLQGASLLVSLSLIVSSPINLVTGWLSDRLPARKPIYLVSIVALIPLYLVAFHLSVVGIALVMLLAGMLFAASPAPSLTVAVRLPGQPPTVGVGVLRSVNNLGIFVVPIALGWIFQTTGSWTDVGYALTILAVLGAIAGWLVRET